MPEWLKLVINSLPLLIHASLVFTVPIAIISFSLSLVLGLIIALIRIFSVRQVSFLMYLYVWIFRGTPLLVQVFVMFYGLPSIGIVFDAFTAIIIVFTLNFSAYLSEIIRSSIIAIPKGQWEAAYSLSLNWQQTMRHIILPQAAITSIAPLSSEFISVLKSTSLASTVTIPELFQTSQRIIVTTYEPLVIYLEVAVIYLFFSSFGYFLQIRLEKFATRHSNKTREKS
ncbi:amino acid ABC transporter permease [Candidatus Liberibacter sp.]|uniref:amino acid ABC transporter permease n=1 Tax=Candidatus Liberibacter sp. TaxID=34022 RepID=UPI0015F4D067|nr:amino acid ABC transporter permease [Candidatus Liberibacter sp.]MBA5723845.1 amino acid ABC transporter permease [Candidatus Liberibacter sp.]